MRSTRAMTWGVVLGLTLVGILVTLSRSEARRPRDSAASGAGSVPGGQAAAPDEVTFAESTPEAAPLGKPGCKPDCRGKGCGSDGCGGSCGKCSGGTVCLADRCVKNRAAELCKLMAGTWKGAIVTAPTHHISGKIFRRGKQCRARFKIEFQNPTGLEYVIQDFVVTISGTQVRLRGVSLVYASPGSSYAKDNFYGTLDKTGKKFRGTNRDDRNAVSPVYLNKK